MQMQKRRIVFFFCFSFFFLHTFSVVSAKVCHSYRCCSRFPSQAERLQKFLGLAQKSSLRGQLKLQVLFYLSRESVTHCVTTMAVNQPFQQPNLLIPGRKATLRIYVGLKHVQSQMHSFLELKAYGTSGSGAEDRCE